MPELKKLENAAAFTPASGNIVNYFAEEEGQIVLKVKKSDGSVATLSGGGGGGGGSSMEFYQCVAVHGPSRVSGFIVSGAGTTAVNGNYVPTELKTEEDGIIYKHETEEYYYFEIWGEKGITTSPTAYPSSGLYYNSYDEGWYPGSGGAEPAPTVTSGNIIVDADVSKTWDGYKAVWSDADGYSFEETLTGGLAYGSALIPAIGGVYDSEAKVEVSKLFESIRPITTNDSACLIYIDGTSLTNQGKAPNKHEVTFGSGVVAAGSVLSVPHAEDGRITTLSKIDGFGGNLMEWTWDYYFVADGDYLSISGHSHYGWTLEGPVGQSIYFRGQGSAEKRLNVIYNKNELVGLSMQWVDGVLHVWSKGVYVGSCTPTFNSSDGVSLGVNTDTDGGNVNYMPYQIKLFRFSNKARYVPGQDFELPDGFI